MAEQNETTFAAGLKTLYPSEVIKNMCYKNNPFFAMVAKDEVFTGDSSKEPIIIGNSQNRSNTFANANVVNTVSVIKAFYITRVSNYATASISNETMLASEGDKGAFLEAAKFEIDGALASMTRSIAVQLFRNGTGTVARIAATATINSATVPVQLANPEDIVNLELNQSIAFSVADGGTIETGTAFIVAIDRGAGTFLASATVGGAATALTTLVPTVAVGDYIYMNAGDLNAGIKGLQAWLPATVALNDNFFQVNRSVDATRLAGIKYDGSAQSIDEALIDAAGLVAREGGNPDHCFVSFKDFRNLTKAMAAKQQVIQYEDTKVDDPTVTVGFTSLVLVGPKGAMKVIPDQNCPVGKAFLLQLDTWKLKSVGEAVRIFKGDGLELLRVDTADSLKLRCFSYAQLSCRAPGWNCVVTLP